MKNETKKTLKPIKRGLGQLELAIVQRLGQRVSENYLLVNTMQNDWSWTLERLDQLESDLRATAGLVAEMRALPRLTKP